MYEKNSGRRRAINGQQQRACAPKQGRDGCKNQHAAFRDDSLMATTLSGRYDAGASLSKILAQAVYVLRA